MKLKTKFSLLTGLLVILIVSGISIFLFIAERQHLIREMEQNKIDMVKSLAQVCKESLIIKDEILLLNYLKLIKGTKGLVYASLTDNNNKILAHTDIKLLGSVLRPSESEKDNIFDVSSQVFIDEKKVGLARIGFSRKILDDEVKNTLNETRNRIFAIAFIALLVGLAGALIFANMMTEPINKLSIGAEMIGQGKLDQRIIVKSRDELGGLAAQFNRMAFKLKELDQLKNDFVASVTHELRSPLTSLSMHIDLFFKGATGTLTEKQMEFLRIMKENTSRLARFIDDLLDVAKIERGKMPINKISFDLPSLVYEVVTLFNIQADKKKIELKAEIQKKLPRVFADPDRTRQVLTNLLSNALKFTPEGGKIEIDARWRMGDGRYKSGDMKTESSLQSPISNLQSDFMIVSVSDTGIGIPHEDLGKIFDKFEQVKGVREKVKGQKGTGLGLAIVKGIVEAQDGKIWAESEPGEGSKFIFTLPIDNKGMEK
ncbi:MAG: HAMP domain-containing histidine kinase [Elusimicrobia bacterium]|nr:HAMP domain-containing histidine kinase [Elusimicrobiota bacterium]